MNETTGTGEEEGHASGPRLCYHVSAAPLAHPVVRAGGGARLSVAQVLCEPSTSLDIRIKQEEDRNALSTASGTQ